MITDGLSLDERARIFAAYSMGDLLARVRVAKDALKFSTQGDPDLIRALVIIEKKEAELTLKVMGK